MRLQHIFMPVQKVSGLTLDSKVNDLLRKLISPEGFLEAEDLVAIDTGLIPDSLSETPRLIYIFPPVNALTHYNYLTSTDENYTLSRLFQESSQDFIPFNLKIKPTKN